jgi:hypothetical protein
MRFLDSIDREAIAGLLERDEYFWLDLTDPGETEADPDLRPDRLLPGPARRQSGRLQLQMAGL